MKKILVHRSTTTNVPLEITFHPASTRTVFRKGSRNDTFRLKMPDMICLTDRDRYRSVMIMRTNTPLSLDFDKVMVDLYQAGFRCLGDRASDMIELGQIEGFDAFLQTGFSINPKIKVLDYGCWGNKRTDPCKMISLANLLESYYFTDSTFGFRLEPVE